MRASRPRRPALSVRPPVEGTGGTVLAASAGAKGQPGYLVYWDQNEEVDFLSMPSGARVSSSRPGT